VSERQGPPCPGVAVCAELTAALAEAESLREDVADLEGDLSRIVSARDLTIRDLRAELACLQEERRLEATHNQSLVTRLLTRERVLDERRVELGVILVERDEAVAQRDAAGQKALQLQERVRALEAAEGGILLPGWACAACKAFNGSAKVTLTHCRCCGVARAT